MIFADFNAKIDGTTTTPGIGTVPPPTTQQPEDYNSAQLRLAAAANDFTCINTTVQHYPSHTFQKTVKQATTQQRIDYLALHNHWAPFAKEVFVDHQNDTASKGEDHYPLYAHIERTVIHRKSQHTAKHYDPNKLQDPTTSF